MYYLLERIHKTCEHISKNIYSKEIPLENYKYIDGNYHNIENIKKVDISKFRDFKTGDLWGGKDQHGWFKCSVKVPEDFAGRTIALNFHTFNEGWDATNPQFIIYVDGEHIQGLDMNHREVILSHNAVAGQEYKIDLHAYAGMLADKKATLHGKLVVIDTDSRELYFNLKVPADVCKELDPNDKRCIDMITILTEACNMVDLRQPKSEIYQESVKKANKFLNEEFYGKFCGHEDCIATCVGHTHIDVAWLWTVAQTREKVARSFSTVLKLMEEYPEYIFISSQPQLYKFLKEDHPKVYERVKEKVKEGVWEPEGSMWLEADCNVTSGESLVRQIIHGKRFFKEEFGVDNEILWLPDVFGYSAALPQILKKAGINYFMTTKISWNQFNKIPNDTFMWKGIDGTEVFTHFITATNPGEPKTSFNTTYNGHIQADAVMGAFRRYQNKNINDDVLISFGWGDGGGGATLEMLENARRFAKGIPGAPKVKMGTSLDYFKRLEQRVKDRKELQKWNGELYLEYHRGTYTSMARNKRDNRKCENLYTALEKLSSYNMLLGKEYPQEEINKSWETILLNQFHDIIPGSSIKEVYDVTEVQYKELLEKVDNMIDENLKNISSKINIKDKSVVVFNSLGFDRDDIVIFEKPEGFENISLESEEGKVASQITRDGKVIFFAKGVPANGYKTYKILDEKVSDDEISCTTTNIENNYFKILLDERGNIKSLIQKENSREVLKEGRLANELLAFEDKPMCFDNWDIDIFYKEKMWKVDDLESIEIVENGPVRASIKIVRKFLTSTITQYMHIYKDIERIDFENIVDWKEKDVLLKVCFPVDINTNEATYEIQYGNVKRPTHNNTSWDIARFEVCGHKWADLSEDGFGVSMLNNCKYGHDIVEGDMRLTLIKSTCDPNPDADKEIHYYTYSLYPHSGDWKDANTAMQAYNLNNPMFAKVEDTHSGELEESFSLAKVDKENVMIEVIKKAEDTNDLIIRVYEYYNKRTKVHLEMFRSIKQVFECNLMEDNLKELDILDTGFDFEIKPYEIKTFKVKLK